MLSRSQTSVECRASFRDQHLDTHVEKDLLRYGNINRARCNAPDAVPEAGIKQENQNTAKDGSGEKNDNKEWEKEEESDAKIKSEEEETVKKDRDRRASEERTTKSSSTGVWGVVGYGSESDLPSSVAECFEDASLLARLQTRLYALLGRANRYRIQRVSAQPIMSLEALRRMVKETRLRLLQPPPSPTPSSSASSLGKDPPDSPRLTPDSPASRMSSPSDTLGKRPGSRGVARDSMQRYWCGEAGVGDEEVDLLQQYLNLQQLANCRKHSAQLRRIRDSLLARVRSRPNSMVKAIPNNYTQVTPSHPSERGRQSLRNFLLDIGFVQYYALLNRHGYDLATAGHMDALDLASVGITEPLHRMAIKFELDLVKQPLHVPAAVPETCEEWLCSLGLDEYVNNFHQNGIYCPLAALGLTKRDLQVMGVYMLGHRKKILLAIAGLKEAILRKD